MRERERKKKRMTRTGSDLSETIDRCGIDEVAKGLKKPFVCLLVCAIYTCICCNKY